METTMIFISAAMPQLLSLYDIYTIRNRIETRDVAKAVLHTTIIGTFCIWIPTTRYLAAASMSYICE